MIPQSQSFQRRQELSGERKKSHSTIMSEVGVYSALLGSSTFLHSTAQHFFGITSHSILYGFAQKKWRFSLSFLPLCLLWGKNASQGISHQVGIITACHSHSLLLFPEGASYSIKNDYFSCFTVLDTYIMYCNAPKRT